MPGSLVKLLNRWRTNHIPPSFFLLSPLVCVTEKSRFWRLFSYWWLSWNSTHQVAAALLLIVLWPLVTPLTRLLWNESEISKRKYEHIIYFSVAKSLVICACRSIQAQLVSVCGLKFFLFLLKSPTANCCSVWAIFLNPPTLSLSLSITKLYLASLHSNDDQTRPDWVNHVYYFLH